jgi:CRP-like cAMP-binding protein
MSENSLLDMVPLFNNLEPEQRNWLSGYFLRCQFPVGSKIFAQDAPAEYFYILVAGEVQVRFKPYDGPELTVSHVQPGEVFGWSAALGNAIYTASAISIGECQLLRMRGADLHKICRESPKNGARILEILASATGGRYNNAYSQVVALLEYGMCNSVEARRNNHGNSI